MISLSKFWNVLKNQRGLPDYIEQSISSAAFRCLESRRNSRQLRNTVVIVPALFLWLLVGTCPESFSLSFPVTVLHEFWHYYWGLFGLYLQWFYHCIMPKSLAVILGLFISTNIFHHEIWSRLRDPGPLCVVAEKGFSSIAEQQQRCKKC